MAIFDEKIEITKRCKGVHCVDLGESFPTIIHLQTLAVSLLFFLLFEKDWTTLLACFDIAKNEPI